MAAKQVTKSTVRLFWTKCC